ncbi:MAG: type IV pilus assembly protein PilM [Planctomycetota bacterium]
MASAAWGIDIGNRALKAVKLQRTADGVTVTDFASIEHDTILSEAGDNRETLVQTALAKFVSRHDIKRSAVCVSVSGQQSFARFVKLPPVEPKKIPEIVRFEAVQQIPFPLDDVEWSYQLFERDDDPDVEVGIFAMRKELVNEHVQQFVDQDLDVVAVQTSPLAVYNAVRSDGRLDKGHAVILDLGAESTDMIIANNDEIWMRSLDIGGNAFTEALAKAFKVDFDKAEEMKRGAKASKYAKQIYQAMRPVFGELVSEVQKSLGFYQSGHRDTKVRKVIALGGGFKLNGLSGYLQKNLQIPVEKPQRYNIEGPEEAGAAAAMAENTLSGACAYGLSLQALGEANVTSSLLPTHIRQDKLWKDKTKYFVLSGAVVAGAALLSFGALYFQNASFNGGDADRQAIDTALRQARGLDSEWSNVANSGGDNLKIVQNVSQLREGSSYWPPLVSDLFAALPAPNEQQRLAISGALGDPLTFDEADSEALTSTPRVEREYVLFESMESVYTDDLGAVVDDPETFYTNAEAVLSGRATTGGAGGGSRGAGSGGAFPGGVSGGYGDFDYGGSFGGGGFPGAGAGAGASAAPVTPTAGGTRRGFIVRMKLISPLATTTEPGSTAPRVYDIFGNDGRQALASALYQIAPSKDRPNLPYRVITAGMSDAQPITTDGEVIDRLRDRLAAREALTTPTEETATPDEPTRRPRQRPGFDPGGGIGGGAFPGDSGSIYGRPSGQRQGGFRPGRQFDSGLPTRGGSASADASDPALTDPATGESMATDTVIEILMAIELDPEPFEDPETTQDPSADDIVSADPTAIGGAS